MLKTQTLWKLGALLLIAPLCVTAPTRADAENDPVSGHMNVGESASELVDTLKLMGTIDSKDGDVYVFKKDGNFEHRRGNKSAKGMTYANDYGRFTVKPKAETNGRPGGAKTTLVLKITSSKKRAGGQIVKHGDTRFLDVRAMSNSDELRNTPGSENDSVIYISIDDKRFDDR